MRPSDGTGSVALGLVRGPTSPPGTAAGLFNLKIILKTYDDVSNAGIFQVLIISGENAELIHLSKYSY